MVNNILPQELIEQILKGNCVLFLGTRLSLLEESNLDQEYLVKELIKYCGYDDLDQSLAKVAEFYELSLGRQSLVERVCNWVEKQTRTSSEADQIIARLPFNIIVTTRTDLLLEETCRKVKKSVAKVVRDEEVSFGDTQKILLLKIHGSIDQKDTLILTERDHLDLFRKRPVLSEFIKVLHAIKTILFIGYDLNNPHAKILHREIVQEIGKFTRRDYAIWKKASVYSTRYWQNENVSIIDCDPLKFLQVLEQELLVYRTKLYKPAKAELKFAYPYPYKFLDHFDSNDAGLFFGREREISVLSTRILAHRLMVIFGSSGVGKTSLIKAGLIPELKGLEVFPIYSRCFDKPLAAIEKAVSDAVASDTGSLIDSSGASEVPLLNLLMKCQQVAGKQIVLFVDQFEELFRLSYELQQDFVKQLAVCLDEGSRLDLRLVLSLRDDFFTELDNLKDYLPFVYRNIFRLQNLSETAAVEAVVRPLDYFDVKYEDKLVELLVEDLTVEGSIAPAQLQIVCSRLHEQFANKGIITVEDYRGLGRAGAMLGAYLDEVLGKFSVSRRTIARRILQTLVSSEKTKKLLSGPAIALYTRLDWHQIENVVSELENHRLLKRLETEEGHKYELVHDYIVHQVWQWFSEQEARIKEVQELIETQSRYWSKYGSLISDKMLEAAYECWGQLVLDAPALEIILRSSIFYRRLKHWNEVAEKSLGEKLVPLYIRLLQDEESEIVSFATIALKKLGATEELNTTLIKVDQLTQSYARKALRQIEEGRPTEDFDAEFSDSEWKEKSMWNTSSIVGIDFGTTSSAIAVVRNQKPIIIPNREGSKFTPSVVAFTDKGEIVVGTPAVLQAATNPERTVFSIKRKLGTDWKIVIGDIPYTAMNIAALIFKSLKQDAESYLGREVCDAVVAFPANFNHQQKHTLRNAAETAGFKVRRMVAEPTAASLAYGLKETYERKVAVYDLGGGTFDISLLELGEGVFEVKAVNGDTSLGGDDFDERIIGYMIKEFKQQHHIDLSSDKVAKIRLKEAAERAKVALSGLETVNVYIPYICADENGVKHLDIDLTRVKFEELCKDLFERTIPPCEAALRDAGIAANDVDELVLVGLSTKIPLVRQSISKFFGKEPRRGVDPDEAVAVGAAIQGGVLGDDFKDVLLLDVTPLSLCLETQGGITTRFIERNTTIPCKKSEIFSTTTDNQTQIEIHVLQGEREMAIDNWTLGRFILDGIPSAPRGIPQIEVTFEIDANALLIVSAKDKATGKEKQRRIEFGVKSRHSQDVPTIDKEISEPTSGTLAITYYKKPDDEKENEPKERLLQDLATTEEQVKADIADEITQHIEKLSKIELDEFEKAVADRITELKEKLSETELEEFDIEILEEKIKSKIAGRIRELENGTQ